MAYKDCKKIGDESLSTYAGYLAEIDISSDYKREFIEKTDELLKRNQDSYSGYIKTLIIGHYHDNSTAILNSEESIIRLLDIILPSFCAIKKDLVEMQNETRTQLGKAIDTLYLADEVDEQGKIHYSKVYRAKEFITSVLWADSRICNVDKGIIIIVYYNDGFSYGTYNATTSEAISALCNIGYSFYKIRSDLLPNISDI